MEKHATQQITQPLTVALLGNPNCGKSSVFNQLTGLRQKVGNFPGVTSDKIIIDAPDENRQVLANFVADRGVINPSADMNWSFAPINDTVKVTFRTTPAATAEEFAAAFDAISPTGQTDDDGFAVYTIDLAP